MKYFAALLLAIVLVVSGCSGEAGTAVKKEPLRQIADAEAADVAKQSVPDIYPEVWADNNPAGRTYEFKVNCGSNYQKLEACFLWDLDKVSVTSPDGAVHELEKDFNINSYSGEITRRWVLYGSAGAGVPQEGVYEFSYYRNGAGAYKQNVSYHERIFPWPEYVTWERKGNNLEVSWDRPEGVTRDMWYKVFLFPQDGSQVISRVFEGDATKAVLEDLPLEKGENAELAVALYWGFENNTGGFATGPKQAITWQAEDVRETGGEKKGCSGTGPVTFSHSPADLRAIELIVPLGQMSGAHVTPTDHQYYYLASSGPYEVRAPAGGMITSIGAMPGSNNDDYRIIIHHTCTFFTIYIHVNKLAERIYAIVGSLKGGENKYPSIPIEAGELLGTLTNQFHAFDFSAHNEDVKLSGYVSPQLYEGEPWKIHTVDPYDYFEEPLRGKLLAKNPRMATPRGGKIDYDVEGRLAGNWFEENTNGYRGAREPYWVTHASFVYDLYDPWIITVSLGDYDGEARQFFVKGNAPDPKEVIKETGLVKYELVDVDYLANGERWDRMTYAESIKGVADNPSRGTVLVQILGNEKLMLESFPGEAAAHVNGFTSNAKVYGR